MFYAITAILTAKGESYRKHSGVRAALHRDFVKTGKINKETGRIYDELFNTRYQADYAPFVEFDKDVVKEQAVEVEKFIKEFKLLVVELL